MENENRILVFSKVENWNSVANVVNKWRYGPLTSALSHRSLGWVITVVTPQFHFISPPNFQQNFSLFSLPSLSLLSHQSQASSHFQFPFLPQQVSSMMNTPWSKHWTRLESSPVSPYRALSSCQYLSLPLPGAIYTSLSPSIFHVHCLIWVFVGIILWMWKWVSLHGLMLVVACETAFLIIFWNIMNFLSSTFLLNPMC